MTATDRFSLEGKTAIITGGSRGIGFAIARGFIDSGARVIITARGEAQLQEAAKELGPNATGMRCDNADPAQIAETAGKAWEMGPVTVLVNNAGISPYYKKIEHVTVPEFDQVVDVNMRGMYYWSVEIANRLTEAQLPGSIISVSSMLGVIPGERLGVYGASKAGVHQLTKTMALEWAERGIRVNAIAPGWTETDFTGDLFASRWRDKLLGPIPMQRFAQPDDITGAALYFATGASGYVTGTILPVDGGRSLA